MSFIDFVSDYIVNSRVAKNNSKRRGVVYYRRGTVAGFTDDNQCQMHTLVSGGSAGIRSEVLANLCITASNHNIPTLILHQGDHELEQLLADVYINRPDYLNIGPGNHKLDPFSYTDPAAIHKLILDSAPDKFNITADGSEYINSLVSFLVYRGRNVTLQKLVRCPFASMPQILSSQSLLQIIPYNKLQSLQSSIAAGQKESSHIKSYLEELYDECRLLLPPSKTVPSVNLADALLKPGIVSLDVVSDCNNLLLRLLCSQIKMLNKSSIPLLLIVDNLSLSAANGLQELCTMRSDRYYNAISGDDLYAMCRSSKELFNQLLGVSSKWFIFRHNSGSSVVPWSNAFSTYQKVDTTSSYGRNKESSSGVMFPHTFHLGSGGGINHGYSYNNKDEAVLQVEEVQNLSERGGIVYSFAQNEIAVVKRFLPFSFQ